jgi:hypothetical protein
MRAFWLGSAQRRLVHACLDFFVGAVDLHEAGLDDARQGSVRGGAHLDRLGHVTRENAFLHGGDEHVLVDGRAKQKHRPLDDDGDGADEPEQDEPHGPTALLKLMP